MCGPVVHQDALQHSEPIAQIILREGDYLTGMNKTSMWGLCCWVFRERTKRLAQRKGEMDSEQFGILPISSIFVLVVP
ncbi:hypothetical protein UB31_08645 [Bradyrhizobium sp. LTSP849]|nr:hypothetical protein UB31_08645 [Bradyrhizobium sp. LTSP849]